MNKVYIVNKVSESSSSSGYSEDYWTKTLKGFTKKENAQEFMKHCKETDPDYNFDSDEELDEDTPLISFEIVEVEVE